MTEMTVPTNAAPTRTKGLASFDDENLADFLKANGRKLGIGAGIVVALALVVWLWQSSARRKEAFASQELLQARASAEAGNMPLAASDLTKLIERFNGTKAADEAVVLLNQVRLVQGQRDVATNALQQFVRSSHPAYVLASAYNLLGGALEDQAKFKDAAESYRLASSNANLDFLKAQYLIDAARAFTLAHDTANARKSYGEVLDRFGRLEQAAEARVRQAEIGGTVPPPPADTTK
jgi:tetratricopeptide (TPR) repeat protein